MHIQVIQVLFHLLTSVVAIERHKAGHAAEQRYSQHQAMEVNSHGVSSFVRREADDLRESTRSDNLIQAELSATGEVLLQMQDAPEASVGPVPSPAPLPTVSNPPEEPAPSPDDEPEIQNRVFHGDTSNVAAGQIVKKATARVVHEEQKAHRELQQVGVPVVHIHNVEEAAVEAKKIDMIIEAAEEKAGIPDTTHTTPEPEIEDSYEDQEGYFLLVVAVSLCVIVGSISAAWSIWMARSAKAKGTDASVMEGEEVEGEDDGEHHHDETAGEATTDAAF
jgi:hypothetical protein